MLVGKEHKLIVIIIKKGWAERVVTGAQKAGARGGTIICARGIGVHETKRLLGIMIEPEKEMVLILTHKDKTKKILQAVVTAGKMEQPGTGIGFVLDVEAVVGIVHLLEQMGVEYEVDG
ncbi:MAG: P-II family nitrogen regulator [Desulfotomaculum sp.]|nr:P-II family nitrogen regulator [Desulfotomaculum sp.]MCL0081283.1 P-II family nitrogen regulator [Peptococcaceae bacterium]